MRRQLSNFELHIIHSIEGEFYESRDCSGTWNVRECGTWCRGSQSLHAQAKPPVYLIGLIDVSNPEAYGKEFAPPAQVTIRNAGGKFIAIGGAGERSHRDK